MLRIVELGLKALLLAIQTWMGVVTVYLVLIAVASYFFRARRGPADSKNRRLAVLVPAHNEEGSLGRLLDSLHALDYPPEAYEVHVVADNCTDATVDIARAAGVFVHERNDLTLIGKGHALSWFMAQLDLPSYAAVVIVDADSVVSDNLLSVANQALSRGWEIGQAYDGVLNRDASSAAAIRALAFELHNYVRPLGAEALGASAGLMGNGMVIATSVLQNGAWEAYGLAEDMEAHARLLREGRRVHFLSEASVLAEMPDSFEGSSGQNARWEAGRLDVARRFGPSLILGGIVHRSWPQLAAGIETLVPPQSGQLIFAVASLAASLATGSAVSVGISIGIIAGQGAYLGLGFFRLRGRGISFRCLTQVPSYIVWKGLLYARVLSGRTTRTWTRADRNVPAVEQPNPAANRPKVKTGNKDLPRPL